MVHAAHGGSVPFLGALKKHSALRPECDRVVKVIDNHLSKNKFFAPEFSIADACLYPRVVGFSESVFPLSKYKHLVRWIEEVGARPGVKDGMSEPK